MLIDDWLEDGAARDGHRVAVVDRTGTHTYAEVNGRANAYGHALRDAGVSPGDRVILALDNGAEWVAAYMGILRAGGIAVPLPRGARSDRFARVVADCSPRAAITDPATATAFSAELCASSVARLLLVGPEAEHQLPRGAIAADQSLAAMPRFRPDVRRIDVDLAAIIYTSGSTGTPRGVMLTHLNFVANTESIVSYLGLRPDDRVMVVLPFYYVYGLSLLHTHLRVGGSLVIDNRFAFPNSVLDSMRRHEVTGFAGVPSTFAVLLHHSNFTSAAIPSLRYVTQAGGSMAPALVDEWRAARPDVPLYVMYGATEAAARLTYLPPADIDRKRGSIGREIPNVRIVVRRADGAEAAVGEVGELVARGSNVSAGYWQAPDDTALAFGPEGYHTGDLGYRDHEGYLFLVGRSRDMLKVGAHRVAAKEIEDVLHDHADVHEAAVVAAAHDLLGEVAVAWVSLRPGRVSTAEDLTQHCRRHLAEFKVPASIGLVDELPKNAAGKIDKQVIRTWVERGVRRS